MSSTKRGDGRLEMDQYPTPRWCTHRLLEAVALPSGLWLEPCAGAGSIIKAVNEVRLDVKWCANEIDPKYHQSLLETGAVVHIGDFLGRMNYFPFDSFVTMITNPPFAISQEILQQCLRGSSSITIFLQRLNWCAGPRAELFRQLKPSVYVLPDRPSFHGRGTDSIEYAWHVFDGKGQFHMLNNTPLEVRKAEKAERLKERSDLDEKQIELR